MSLGHLGGGLWGKGWLPRGRSYFFALKDSNSKYSLIFRAGLDFSQQICQNVDHFTGN